MGARAAPVGGGDGEYLSEVDRVSNPRFWCRDDGRDTMLEAGTMTQDEARDWARETICSACIDTCIEPPVVTGPHDWVPVYNGEDTDGEPDEYVRCYNIRCV